MKRIAPCALGILAAALLALSFSPADAVAGERATAKDLDPGLFSRRKVGRSGQVYCWKPDC